MHALTRLMPMSFAVLLSISCGGSQAPETEAKTEAKAKAGDPNSVFGPLEIGADWQSYTKLNTEPVESGDHGRRFVDTYVNDIGLEAYKTEGAEIPVGTIVVKTSWERDGDNPSTTPGPIFVMEKRAPGYDPDNYDWYYAIHWESPTEPLKSKYGQMYWRSPSPRVTYCFGCHNDYDRQLGMIPEEQRAW